MSKTDILTLNRPSKNWIGEISGVHHVIKVEQNNNSVLFNNMNLLYFEKRVNKPWNNRLNGNNYRGKSCESVRNKRSNPIERDGRVSECLICGSRMYWARNCTHSYENMDRNKCEEVQITLMSAHMIEDKLDTLLKETIGYALIDTGCSKTVCGSIWLDCFLNSFKERNL